MLSLNRWMANYNLVESPALEKFAVSLDTTKLPTKISRKITVLEPLKKDVNQYD